MMPFTERSGTGVAGELAQLANQVRAETEERGATAGSLTWRTADGEVTLDYRAGDWLKITFAGDAPERTYVLSPDWGAS